MDSHSPAPPDAGLRRYKKPILFGLKVAFIAALFVFLFRPETFGFPADMFNNLSLGALGEHIRGLDAGTAFVWLSFAALIKIAGIFAGIMRWRILLRAQGVYIPVINLARMWFWGRAIGLFLPGTLGLDGYRLVESSRYTGEVVKCTTVVAVEKLTGFIALFGLVFLTVPLGFGIVSFNPALLGAVILFLGAFIAVTLTLLFQPRIIQVIVAVLPLPGALHHLVNKFGAAVTAYSTNRKALLTALGFGFCVHIGTILMYFGTMKGVGAVNVGTAELLFAATLVILGSVLAPTISGIGVREIVMTAAFGAAAGAESAFLFGHLGLWFGEVVPLILSLPLLLMTGKPSKTDLVAEMEKLQQQLPDWDEAAMHLPPERLTHYRGLVHGTVLAGVAAGLLAGTVVGLVESAYIVVTTTGLAEYSALWWGPLYYALPMAAAGLGIAGALLFLYLLVDRFAPTPVSYGLVYGACLAGAFLVIGTFRFMRDYNAEVMPSPGQLAVIAIIAATIGGAAALAAGYKIHRWFRTPMRFVPASVTAAIAVILIGSGAASLARPSVEVPAFEPAAQAAGPNMVLIVADALRADHLYTWNSDAPTTTPHINALVNDSVAFLQGQAQSSWTRPSFSTIFSGLYPETHTVELKASVMPDDVTTLAEVLHDHGYYTGGYGNNPHLSRAFNLPQGFLDYAYLTPDYRFGADYSASRLILYEVLRRVADMAGNRILRGRIAVERFYQPAEVVTDRALAWLDNPARPADAPFLLFLHYMDPHDPFMEPTQRRRGFARSAMPNPDPDQYLELFLKYYAGEIDYMDGHIGRLMDGLRDRGLYDDTLIVFTSDHGEEFFEHGNWWHGLSLYQEVIHVPVALKLPGSALAGTVHDGFARHVDLAPTMLRAAGAAIPSAMQGVPLVTASLDAISPEGFAINNSYSSLDFEALRLHAVQTTQHKLITANEDNWRGLAPIEFYDLVADPGEQENLADDPRMELERANLHRYLDETRAANEAGAPPPVLLDEIDATIQEQLEALGYIGD